MTNEERVAKWRQFKYLATVNPKRYRIQHHGDDRGGHVFSLQEFLLSRRHRKDPFKLKDPFEDISMRIPPLLWDWTIIDHSDAWFPPTRESADSMTQSIKAV